MGDFEFAGSAGDRLTAASQAVWGIAGDETPLFECAVDVYGNPPVVDGFTISDIPYLSLGYIAQFCTKFNVSSVASFDRDARITSIYFSSDPEPYTADFAAGQEIAKRLVTQVEDSKHDDADQVRVRVESTITSILGNICPSVFDGGVTFVAHHFNASLVVRPEYLYSGQIRNILNIPYVTAMIYDPQFTTGISVQFTIRDTDPPPRSYSGRHVTIRERDVQKETLVPHPTNPLKARSARKQSSAEARVSRASFSSPFARPRVTPPKTDLANVTVNVRPVARAAPGAIAEEEESEEEDEEEDVGVHRTAVTIAGKR